MKSKLFFILALVGLIMSCQSNEKNITETLSTEISGKFIVTAPKNWTTLDTLDKDKEEYVKMRAPVIDSTSKFRESIYVGIINYPDVEFYIKELMKALKTKAVYFKDEANDSIQINGYNIKWQKYVIQLDSNSKTVEQKVYFISDNKNTYMITCSAGVNQIKTIQPQIDTVLNSFKILY